MEVLAENKLQHVQGDKAMKQQMNLEQMVAWFQHKVDAELTEQETLEFMNYC